MWEACSNPIWSSGNTEDDISLERGKMEHPSIKHCKYFVLPHYFGKIVGHVKGHRWIRDIILFFLININYDQPKIWERVLKESFTCQTVRI